MKISITLFFILILGQVSGQTKISGVVADARGEVIPGANIFLINTYDGGSSDEHGKFEFGTTETGSQLLAVKFIGYKEFKTQIEIGKEDIVVSVRLEEEINELEAVIITAGAFTASDVSRRTIFRAIDIATTAGATADIAGALNTLPGTQKVGESGRLFVRGGDGNEAKTFIDGLVVLDAYNPSAPNTPSRGRFLPFMFKGTSFSTGGYSAEYGQALSSALVLDSKDKAELTRTDFGILSVGGDIGHTQVWERGSIGGKVQYTNIRPYTGLVRQEVDWSNAPVSIEGSTAFRHDVGKSGLLKFYGNFNNSNFSLYQHDIDDENNKQLYDLSNNYRYLNGFYNDILNKNWSIRGGVSYSYLHNKTGIGNNQIDELQKGLHAKTVLEGSVTDHLEIKSGVEIIQRTYTQTYTREDQSQLLYSFRESVTATFVEADVYASNKFVTRVGSRIEYNDLIKRFSVDPRASLAYKTGSNGQISFAYGKFRQSAKNEFVKVNNDLDPEKADHYILNYQYVKDNRTFRIETYFKQYTKLVKFIDGEPSDLNNAGTGEAKGIELFWRDHKTIDKLDYWVSYSYLDTKRNYLYFPYRATPSFASQHNFSLVTKYFIQKIKSQAGITYSYSSGRPYNNPNLEKFNSAKTPAYADLSFNWSYLPTPSLIIHFSCTNVLGRDNIFGYEYSSVLTGEGTYNGRAIRQAAPRFLFLAIFITLSKGKSVNQLPNL